MMHPNQNPKKIKRKVVVRREMVKLIIAEKMEKKIIESDKLLSKGNETNCSGRDDNDSKKKKEVASANVNCRRTETETSEADDPEKVSTPMGDTSDFQKIKEKTFDDKAGISDTKMSEADRDSEKGSTLIHDNSDVEQEKGKAFDAKARITDTKMSEADRDSEKGSTLIGDNTDVEQEKGKAFFEDKARITDTRMSKIDRNSENVCTLIGDNSDVERKEKELDQKPEQLMSRCQKLIVTLQSYVHILVTIHMLSRRRKRL